ncbi:MAG: hypothetical protein ACJAT2_000537 [Bacteriovoracaceae bacterium]|jgi:hypothetical protein
MKPIILILIIALSLTSCSTNKKARNYQHSVPDSSWPEDSDKIETRVVKVYVTSKSNMLIKGMCYIETNDNRDACEDITLHLVDLEGNDRVEAVTDSIGAFTFSPKDRRLRSIEVKSPRYKLKAGKVIVQAGAFLTIILVKK